MSLCSRRTHTADPWVWGPFQFSDSVPGPDPELGLEPTPRRGAVSRQKEEETDSAVGDSFGGLRLRPPRAPSLLSVRPSVRLQDAGPGAFLKAVMFAVRAGFSQINMIG